MKYKYRAYEKYYDSERDIIYYPANGEILVFHVSMKKAPRFQEFLSRYEEISEEEFTAAISKYPFKYVVEKV